MMKNSKVRIGVVLAAVVFLGLSLTADAGTRSDHVPAQLPDPDGEPGDATKPVQVYILAGQSNMVGFGQLKGSPGTMESYLKSSC